MNKNSANEKVNSFKCFSPLLTKNRKKGEKLNIQICISTTFPLFQLSFSFSPFTSYRRKIQSNNLFKDLFITLISFFKSLLISVSIFLQTSFYIT
jgi:hypothetical protein